MYHSRCKGNSEVGSESASDKYIVEDWRQAAVAYHSNGKVSAQGKDGANSQRLWKHVLEVLLFKDCRLGHMPNLPSLLSCVYVSLHWLTFRPLCFRRSPAVAVW